MLKIIAVALLATGLMPVGAFASGATHTPLYTAMALSGHGLPPNEANSSILAEDVLGPKYCGLPYDASAVHRAWVANARSLGVPLANLTAEIKDRVRELEGSWSKNAPKLCNAAVKYGKEVGYLPQTFDKVFR